MAEFHAPAQYDPETGITEEMWYDDRDNKIHVRRKADVEHIYRANQIAIARSPRDFYRDDGVYHKATIPNIMIEKWKREGFDWYQSTDIERRRKLNQHPELHVRRGRL